MEQKFPRRWKQVDKISYLQRKIILHSIAYYEFDKSFISDSHFDELSRQLVRMQNEYLGNIEKDTEYGYMMYDFDGSTGFDLYGKLNPSDREYLYDMTAFFIYKTENKNKKKSPQKRRLF